MKRKNIRSYLIGFFSSLLLIAFGASALAVYQQEAILNYTGIQITLDGQAIVPVDAAGNPVEPFIINGTTYLPVRAVSNALGLGVEWDGEHQTVKLTSRKSYSEMTIEELRPLLQTVTAGKLTIVTSPDFAPYEFYSIGKDGNCTLAGLDIYLAGYIADYLGLELELIPTDFDGALLTIDCGNADLCIAGLSPTPDKAAEFDLSCPYYQYNTQFFVCLSENVAQFPNLSATNDPQYKIAALRDTVQSNLLQTYSPNSSAIYPNTESDLVAGLLSGEIDGAYMDSANYALRNPFLCAALEVPSNPSDVSIAVRKGHPALLSAVNLAISAAQSDGSLDTFIAYANDLAQGEIYEGLISTE